MRHPHRLLALGLCLAPALALAQAPPASPGVTLTQPGVPPPAPAAPPAAVASVRPTLVPEAGDPSNVDEVVLPAKPVLILSGKSTWDDGLKTIRATIAAIEAEIAREGLVPAGRPLANFTQTTDADFQFDAMVPIAAAPAVPPTLPARMRFGTTPAGKAWRFVHKGPYDDIDSTYETVTTYLDAKDIVAKDSFLEEYATDFADAADAKAEVNIFVQPK